MQIPKAFWDDCEHKNQDQELIMKWHTSSFGLGKGGQLADQLAPLSYVIENKDFSINKFTWIWRTEKNARSYKDH